MVTAEQFEEFTREIHEEMTGMRVRQRLILSSVRNLLAQKNKNGVNDYLIEKIERNL